MRVFFIAGLLVLAASGAYFWAAQSQESGGGLAATMDRLGVPVPAQSLGTNYSTGEGEGEPIRLVVGLDLSKSNPLTSDRAYAGKVADRVAGMVEEMAFRSEIVVRTFGSYGGDTNTFRFDATVSSRYRPDQLAADVRALISSVPELVGRGTWQAQKKTNILGFLENIAVVTDCHSLPTTVVLLTDGIEDSEYVNLRNETASLPAPPRAIFADCAEMQMLGIGQGTASPTTTRRLRDEWTAWSQDAGFQSFVGLNDW